tara:strand:+ start:3834 stop:4055 length:222 start_codon:yes stop_codon:yes gene_type:complete
MAVTIEKCLKMIAIWEKNVIFIEERLEIQNTEDWKFDRMYGRGGKMYHKYDVKLEKLKIRKAKRKLKQLQNEL